MNLNTAWLWLPSISALWPTDIFIQQKLFSVRLLSGWKCLSGVHFGLRWEKGQRNSCNHSIQLKAGESLNSSLFPTLKNRRPPAAKVTLAIFPERKEQKTETMIHSGSPQLTSRRVKEMLSGVMSHHFSYHDCGEATSGYFQQITSPATKTKKSQNGVLSMTMRSLSAKSHLQSSCLWPIKHP